MGPEIPQLLRLGPNLVARLTQIRNMNRPAFQQCHTHDRATFWLCRDSPDVVAEFRRETIGFCKEELSAYLPSNASFVGLAKSSGGFNKRLQYGLEIEMRLADDFQHVGRCRLLFTRLRQFAGQSVNLVLGVGSRYVTRRYFASFGPNRVLALRRLSASTASLHVAPDGSRRG
jgi:hypothetical protein